MAVNQIEVRQRDGVYRRGVLLGMTMAEIMILLLFCLLMAFILQLEDLDKDIKKSEQASDLIDALQRNVGVFEDDWERLSLALTTLVARIGTDAVSEIAIRLEEHPEMQADEFARAIEQGLDHYNVIKTELSALHEAPPKPDTVAKVMAERMAEGEQFQESAPALAELEKIKETVREATGQEPTPEALKKMLADAAEWQADGRDDLAQKNQDLKDRLDRKEEALTRAEDQLRGKGQGLEYPSCFQTEDGKIQYVFHIEFDEQALNLQALPVLGNEQLWQRLSFGQITTGKGISVKQYQDETDNVFKWSKENSCRFFVRIVDRTLAVNKSQYKLMKRNIESRFYTWEPPQLAAPSSSTL